MQKQYIPAPKPILPGHAESYNPPGEYLPTDAEREAFEASRRLLWDCTRSSRARILFDEAVGSARSDNLAIMQAARFFHDIDMLTPSDAAAGRSTPPPFEHPCGPDLYRGRLLLDSPDSFRLLWTVEGPRKQGRVSASYERSS